MHSLQPSAGSLDRGAKSGRAVPLSNLQFQVGTSYCRHSESLRLSSHRDRHTRACTPPGSDQDAAASQLSVLSKAEGRSPPWSFHFQHNERYLEWSDSAQEQLLRLHIAEKLKLVRSGADGQIAVAALVKLWSTFTHIRPASAYKFL